MITFTLTGSVFALCSHEAIAAVWQTMPPLSSAMPRPKTRPLRRVGSKGGLFQISSRPGGWTS
jgi:hypothetical protein